MFFLNKFIYSIIPKAALLSVTSVDFGSKDQGKITLSGGNEVEAPERGLVVARLNPDLKELVIGDFKKFDTYQSDGAKQFKSFIEVNIQLTNIFY